MNVDDCLHFKRVRANRGTDKKVIRNLLLWFWLLLLRWVVVVVVGRRRRTGTGKGW